MSGARALMLSAGLGTRLRPLTALIPKPLLPVCGRPVGGHTLHDLAGFGCALAVINLHHLGTQVAAAFGAQQYDLALRYRPEATLLGTLGPLAAARDLFADAEAIVVVNGDSLCAWPFAKLLRQHARSGADATLLLHKTLDPAPYGGGVGVDGDGRVTALRDMDPIGAVAGRHVFLGCQVIAPRLLDRVAEGPGDLVGDLYMPLLRDGGHIASLRTREPWHDLGTPQRYHAGVLAWADRAWPGRDALGGRRGGVVAHPLAVGTDSATLRAAVIEADARLGAGAHVERTVVLAGAHVPAGARLVDCVIGPGVTQLPEGASIEGRMITAAMPGQAPGPRATVMGDLVYTPLESATA
ncbi:MAG: NDP-sugar synthase [Acidobacteriota bacterium]